MTLPEYLLSGSGRLVVGVYVVWMGISLLRRLLEGVSKRTQSKTDGFVVAMTLSAAEPLGHLAAVVWAWQALPIERQGDWLVFNATRLLAMVLVVRLINSVLLRLLKTALRRVPSSVSAEALVALPPLIRNERLDSGDSDLSAESGRAARGDTGRSCRRRHRTRARPGAAGGGAGFHQLNHYKPAR